jgi:amino acid permease
MHTLLFVFTLAQTVLHTNTATTIYVLLGLFGYFFAYTATQDDILLNFAPDDSVIVWGRLGLGVTMLIAIPMLVLPCRYVNKRYCT